MLSLVLLLLGLAGCQAGSQQAEGGIDGTGLGVGPVTGYGSIYLQDTHYATDRAEVFIDGVPAGLDQLKLGMHVSVEGPLDLTDNSGEALRIEYRDTLRGPLSFISVEANTLRVLGQTLRIDENTHLYGFDSLEELQPGDYLRVSGPAAAQGEMAVTLVERLADGGDESVMVGVVRNLDPTTLSFFIMGMRVDYSAAAVVPGDLHAGQLVEVAGELSHDHVLLRATRVQAVERPILAPGASVRIHAGSVTGYAGADDFEVEYLPAYLSPALDPSLADALAIGAIVTLDGVFDADGRIEVTGVDVREGVGDGGAHNDLLLRVSGALDRVDAQAGVLTVFGVAARYDETTRFKDISGQYPELAPADLRPGDMVTVAGGEREGGFFAQTVLYEPFVPSHGRKLQGRTDSIAPSEQRMQVLGVTVNGGANTRYYDASEVTGLLLPPPGPPIVVPDETQVDAAAFFQRLEERPELLVSVHGRADGEAVAGEIAIILPAEYLD